MDVLITGNRKRISILLVILMLAVTLTGCWWNEDKDNEDNKDSSDEIETGTTEDYIKMANETTKLIATTNQYEQLKFDLDNLRNRMTDKVYDNSFDLNVPYLAGALLVEGYNKTGYEILETIVNQTEDGEGSKITDIYIIYNMQLMSAEGTEDTDDSTFNIGKVAKYTFSKGKLIEFQIIL